MKDSSYTCNICPRGCHVRRDRGETGRCLQSASIRIALYYPHMWEEPCISGTRGSGTVFFCGCPLHCVYCQNYRISQSPGGRIVDGEELSDIFIELRDEGVHNINLVTPTHFAPWVAEAIDIARGKGLNLPVVYNCGGYELTDTLKLLSGRVDIYMPDFKYRSQKLAERYSSAPDYFEVACKAIDEMVNQVGPAVFDEDGLMKRGVLVRHLVLPGSSGDSKDIIEYLHTRFGDKIWISIMNQYTPSGDLSRFPELQRPVSDNEYDEVVQLALMLGIKNAFIQQGGTVSQSFIPPFEL